MTTLVKIGPADHGRPMTYEEHMAADCEQGHKYELIDGKLYVSPEANLPEDYVEQWLLRNVQNYAAKYPKVINYVTNKARVFLPRRRALTIPEPDLAAFHNFPVHLPLRELRWQDVSPLLVGEILSAGDPDKDLVRNVRLYWQVPTIEEYWVFDTRDAADEPTMRVYRRQTRKWGILEVPFNARYSTPLLPGFELVVNPRA